MTAMGHLRTFSDLAPDDHFRAQSGHRLGLGKTNSESLTHTYRAACLPDIVSSPRQRKVAISMRASQGSRYPTSSPYLLESWMNRLKSFCVKEPNTVWPMQLQKALQSGASID